MRVLLEDHIGFMVKRGHRVTTDKRFDNRGAFASQSYLARGGSQAESRKAGSE